MNKGFNVPLGSWLDLPEDKPTIEEIADEILAKFCTPKTFMECFDPVDSEVDGVKVKYFDEAGNVIIVDTEKKTITPIIGGAYG